MGKQDIVSKIAALRGFGRFSMDTGLSAAEVVDQAEHQVSEQAPASWSNGYPAALVGRVARIMVQKREPAARAYLQA